MAVFLGKEVLNLLQKTVHYGYVCDRCGMQPIKGIRYKCANCIDYDLCSACEEIDLHEEKHLLLKIRRPLQNGIPFKTPLINNLYDELNNRLAVGI